MNYIYTCKVFRFSWMNIHFLTILAVFTCKTNVENNLVHHKLPIFFNLKSKTTIRIDKVGLEVGILAKTSMLPMFYVKFATSIQIYIAQIQYINRWKDSLTFLVDRKPKYPCRYFYFCVNICSMESIAKVATKSPTLSIFMKYLTLEIENISSL